MRGVVDAVSRPAGIASALVAPGVATYTAVLLADTSVPSWHEAWPELPFVFAGSALSGSAGLALALGDYAGLSPGWVMTFSFIGGVLALATIVAIVFNM